MESVFILILIVLSLLYIGLMKKDLALLFFASTFSIISGLDILNKGFGDMLSIYYNPIGFLFIFLGLYVLFRSGFELFQTKKTEKNTA